MLHITSGPRLQPSLMGLGEPKPISDTLWKGLYFLGALSAVAGVVWIASVVPSKKKSGLAGTPPRHKYRGGETVVSWFRAPWRGEVVSIEKRKDAGDLVTVRVTHDRHGKLLRKPQMRTLDEHWLDLYPRRG